MSDASNLEYFGRFVAENLRDRALDDFELLAKRHWKAPALQDLQTALSELPPSELEVARRALRRVVDSAIHDFLFALQEEHDSSGPLEVRVNGEAVAATSDGLQGEPYSEEGWFARFSRFGKPPENA